MLVMATILSLRVTEILSRFQNVPIAESWIDIVTCVAMLVGGIYAWIQWRKSRVVSRNIFLQGLLKDFNVYEVRWQKIVSSLVFSGDWRKDSETRIAMEELLRFYSQICYKKTCGAISVGEFAFFAFRIHQVLQNEDVVKCLEMLANDSGKRGMEDFPYSPLIQEGCEIGLDFAKAIQEKLKGKIKMKNGNVVVAICFAVSFLAVLMFSWNFISEMTGILSRGQCVDCYRTTNTVMRSAVTFNVSGVDNKVEEGDASVIAAYDSLSNELSSWMAIMGIFAAVFGLLIPIGSYFLQQRSLLEERGVMREDFKKALEEKIGQLTKDYQLKIEKMQSDYSDDMTVRMKPMWNFLASNFNRFLVADAVRVMGGAATTDEIANFVIGVDIYFDCLVRSGNVGVLVDSIRQFMPILDAVRNQKDNWAETLKLLKQRIQPSESFMKGSDYAKLIGKDGECYGWLKSFYDDVVPWKFA